MRQEILIGVRRRRRWSDEHKLQVTDTLTLCKQEIVRLGIGQIMKEGRRHA
ncbi:MULTISPECIES: hypothetical protein [Nguyenibacter]|uniref:Uncharacterized protein n=1 Tax=Nguyenibacter vanlangensis TaxID=1216886 RepID=A0A7Y7M6M6_9PROT|nr:MULTISPECIES: hypothetical protein [Nguyenibacter]NVN11109.1 hypothetical protein [Nguyenibacter vanlangensis]WRH89517.1 hypothetical protein QN315_07980 [Nguyenibacter sp. L1]